MYVRHKSNEGEEEFHKRNIMSLDMFEKYAQVEVNWERGVLCDEVGKEKKKIKITYLNINKKENVSEVNELCVI